MNRYCKFHVIDKKFVDSRVVWTGVWFYAKFVTVFSLFGAFWRNIDIYGIAISMFYRNRLYVFSVFTRVLCLPEFYVYQSSVFTRVLCLPEFCVYQSSMFTRVLCLPEFCVYQSSVFNQSSVKQYITNTIRLYIWSPIVKVLDWLIYKLQLTPTLTGTCIINVTIVNMFSFTQNF